MSALADITEHHTRPFSSFYVANKTDERSIRNPSNELQKVVISAKLESD
jgi:hypothetical protein